MAEQTINEYLTQINTELVTKKAMLKDSINAKSATGDVVTAANPTMTQLKEGIDALVSGVQSDWNETDTAALSYILNKPTSFPPDTHSHSEYAPASHTHTEYAASNHNHDARYVVCGGSSVNGQFDKTATAPTGTARLNYSGYFYGTRVYGAWYNDYAEIRESDAEYEGGTIVSIDLEGRLVKSTKRLAPVSKIVSDTFGMCIGDNDEYKHKVVIAVSGRVLCTLDQEVTIDDIGKPLCSGEDGKASIMTRQEVMEYPERMIGVISSIPKEKVWGNEGIKINNRVWIEVK